VVPRSILACALLVITLGLGRDSVVAGSGTDSLLYTVAKSYEALAWTHGAERFPAGATILVSDAKGKHPLVAEFAASADPSISFDGQRVLFAARKKSTDHWQIWEVPALGGEAKRISSSEEDCIRPFYLPDDRIVYARKQGERFVVEAADLNGGKPLALTYGPASFLPTDVLRDGRVLVESGFPLGVQANAEIYTVYPDGSGFESYRCDHNEAHHGARQVASGDIVFATRAGLRRFTSARAKEVQIPAPNGEYAGDVAELSSGEWLGSWRPDGSVPFRLVIWPPDSGTFRTFAVEDGANLLQAVVLRENVVPKRFPSALHDWNNANLLCLNAYTSKYAFAPGSIHQVRFYRRDSSGNPHLLGTAAVEHDGSFFVQVPTEQAIQMELLDSTGKTIRREEGYFWMRRGEQRVCVGCHAGPETAPENAVPAILLKSTTPADMTGAASASGGH
jgi:hypothetical protein